MNGTVLKENTRYSECDEKSNLLCVFRYMEPLTRGSYPESMSIRVKERFPKFDEKERKMVNGSFDFIGFNYYGAIYAVNKPNSTSYSYATDSEMVITG